MAEWIKDQENGGFSKMTKLTDGAIVSLLVSAEGQTPRVAVEASYSGFCSVDEARNKAFGYTLVASAIAIMSYFNVIDSFNGAGFSISSDYLKHLSLLSGAISGLYISALESKHSFYRAFFDHVFWREPPSQRALLLLKFPKAFDVVKFSHASVGYPKDIFPERGRQFLPFAALALIALAVFMFASGALYIALGLDVWRSGALGPIASKATVIGSAFLSIVGLLMPKHWHFKRRYRHYGLSNRLTMLKDRDADKWRHYHQLIFQIRVRMNLVRDED